MDVGEGAVGMDVDVVGMDGAVREVMDVGVDKG